MDNLLDFSTNIYNIEQYLKVGDGSQILNYKNISISVVTKIIGSSGYACKIFSNISIADHIFSNCSDKTDMYKYVTLACHHANDTAATELFTKYYDKRECVDICILLGLTYFKNRGYEFYGLRMEEWWQKTLRTRYGKDFVECTRYEYPKVLGDMYGRGINQTNSRIKSPKKYNYTFYYNASHSNKKCCLAILQEHFDSIIEQSKLSESNFYLYHIAHIICGVGNNNMISDVVKLATNKKILVCEVPYCPLQHALTNINLTEETVNELRHIMRNCMHNDKCIECTIL